MLAQQARQQKAVGRAGNAIERCQRRHHRTNAALDQGSERRQIDVVQQALRQECRVVVAPAFPCAVADEVPGRDQQHVSVAARSSPWNPRNCARHGGAKIGFFAGAFHHAAPARIARPQVVDERMHGRRRRVGRRRLCDCHAHG